MLQICYRRGPNHEHGLLSSASAGGRRETSLRGRRQLLRHANESLAPLASLHMWKPFRPTRIAPSQNATSRQGVANNSTAGVVSGSRPSWQAKDAWAERISQEVGHSGSQAVDLQQSAQGAEKHLLQDAAGYSDAGDPPWAPSCPCNTHTLAYQQNKDALPRLMLCQVAFACAECYSCLLMADSSCIHIPMHMTTLTISSSLHTALMCSCLAKGACTLQHMLQGWLLHSGSS